MNYQNKTLNWLQTRLSKVYSMEAQPDIQLLSQYLNQLDHERLNNYQIKNFDDLQQTDNIAKILELSRDQVYEAQISNLANQLSVENLNIAIRNLPENQSLDRILTRRIEQLILSESDPRIPRTVRKEDLSIINYFESLEKTPFIPI